MQITELIGHLLAELAAHGNTDVQVWDDVYGGGRDVSTVDFFFGYELENGRVVLDYDRRKK